MIGEQIAFFRKQRNLTQGQLGERLGVSDRTVSKWENGDSLPAANIIPAIADTLGVALDEIFGVNMKKQEDGISATIQETIRSELERILPDVIREAIEDSINELTSSCEGTVGHELTVCSKDKSCVIKTNGEASVHGPVTVNGEPNKWLLNVINTRSQLITMGVYASKDEAGQALQSLMNAYTGGFSKIFL